MSLETTDRESIGSRFWDWPFIGLSALWLSWITQPWQVIKVRDLLVLIVSVGSVFALLWWSDKYEREPLRTIAWAFLWGAFPACLASYFLEGRLTTLSGGVLIEEGMKLLALYLIFRRGSIQSWTDGLVIGGYLGLGFAANEDLFYAINSDNAFDVLVSRGIFSIFAHTFFSGLGAVVIVMGFLSRRWWLAAIGLLFACFLHLTWNTVLAYEIFDENMLGFFFFFSVIPPVVLFLTALLVRKDERHRLLVQGGYAIRSSAMTEEELWLVVNFKARRFAMRNQTTRDQKRALRAKIYDQARLLLNKTYEPTELS